jgi:hypothetical protein
MPIPEQRGYVEVSGGEFVWQGRTSGVEVECSTATTHPSGCPECPQGAQRGAAPSPGVAPLGGDRSGPTEGHTGGPRGPRGRQPGLPRLRVRHGARDRRLPVGSLLDLPSRPPSDSKAAGYSQNEGPSGFTHSDYVLNPRLVRQFTGEGKGVTTYRDFLSQAPKVRPHA